VDNAYSKDIYDRCVQGLLGCVEHKNMLADIIWQYLEPIREKYFYYLEHEEELWKIASYGNEKAAKVAKRP